MTLRKSTWIWLAILAVSVLAIPIDGDSHRLGWAADLFFVARLLSGWVVCSRALLAAFRLAFHRLTLRLAFSYFLIGIVPIPLLAALFGAFAYLLSHQIIATRLRTEVDTLAELVPGSGASLPRIRVGADGRVTASDVEWLRPGEPAAWAEALTDPHPIIGDDRVWIALRGTAADGILIRLMPIQDRSAPWLQRLADRTGYDVAIELGSGQETASGYEIRVGKDRRLRDKDEPLRFVSPRSAAPNPSKALWDRQWLAGLYADRAVAVIGKTSAEKPIVAFLGRTSPRLFVSQLFAQGVPEVTRVVRLVLVGIAATLLFVYLIALMIAFVLVGSIVRNVNRLSRATAAMSRGDFSVRVNSKARDQIGDLARSFDGMAASIQKLLQDTARKEKLESELAIARAIQESFLPESGESWKGFQASAHFEPAADLGGDYYDILPMPDGRTAVSIGDVSGHGLPTALVAAAARASLATFVELGVAAEEAFLRLGRRTERSHDSGRRLYTTLAFFAYDAARRVGTLTNAGHPAPYRVSGTKVERLEINSLPIGLLPGKPSAYASKDFSLSPGDRLVFFTDGVVEAADANEDPWGYERLEQLLARDGQQPADQLIASILSAVAAHVGSTPLEDDRTILLLTIDPA